MSDRRLTEVTKLFDYDRRNIPETLRLIASQIESGKFGTATAVTVVVMADVIDVCHLGEGTSDKAHLLLCLGQRKLEQMILRQRGEE